MLQREFAVCEALLVFLVLQRAISGFPVVDDLIQRTRAPDEEYAFSFEFAGNPCATFELRPTFEKVGEFRTSESPSRENVEHIVSLFSTTRAFKSGVFFFAV